MPVKGKCIGCRLCEKVCIWNAISIETGEPVINLEKCNLCDHCAAVCPTDAVESPMKELAPLAGKPLEYDQAVRFLRYARSVRFFKKKGVERETLESLVDIGRYAQTASNTQGISYLVVDGREKVVKMIEMLCDVYETMAADDPDLKWVKLRVDEYRSGRDTILRDAPQLILALSENGVRRKQNAQFCLTFIALLAPSMGIGTCWAGIFERFICHEKYGAPFRKYLGLEEGTNVEGALMVGYPDISFRRFASRKPLKLGWF